MKSSKSAPTGTCTALIGNQQDFSDFNGLRYLSYLDEQLNKWHLSAISAVNSHGLHQEIWLWLPNDGDVVNRTYDIIKDHGDTTKANATWAKASAASYQPYPALTGSVTVTLNTGNQTLEGRFNFDGENGSTKVTVSKGSLQLEKFADQKKTRATGSVECSLNGAISAPYKSTVVHYSEHPASGSFPPARSCWSEQSSPKPDLFIRRVVINIAKGLPLGTYPITPESKDVRAFLFDITGNREYIGISGTITVTSTPSAEPVTGEVFSGAFSFKAETVIDGVTYSVDAQSGNFNITI